MSWPTVRLADLCEINIGRTPSRSNRSYWGNGHPWLSIADMNQGRDLAATKEQISDSAAATVMGPITPVGTVLLSFKLSIGKVGVAKIPLYTNEAIASLPIRDSRRITPNYLYWALHSIDLSREANRAAMGGTLNKAQLQRVRIPLPSVEEQQRIANILDHADSVRAKRRETLAHLDELGQSIFLDMFGNVVTNDRRWAKLSVGDFVQGFESGKSIAGERGQDVESMYRILKVSAVTSGRFLSAESKPLPHGYVPPERHLVRDGDLLFSRANTTELIGATALVDNVKGKLALPDKIWRFVWPPEQRIDVAWVWSLFQRPEFRHEIGRRATGTSGSMQNISQSKVLSICVGVPPLVLQRQFGNRVRAVRALTAAARNALDSTNVLFAAIQRRAFARMP